MYRSILKEDVIYFSNYNTFYVGLQCEICLDIDSLRAKSRVTYHWLVQNVKYICFLLNLDLTYLF